MRAIILLRESRQDRYSTKADVFSLGCALFTMLTGEVAFSLRVNEEMLESTVNLSDALGKVPEGPSPNTHVTLELRRSFCSSGYLLGSASHTLACTPACLFPVPLGSSPTSTSLKMASHAWGKNCGIPPAPSEGALPSHSCPQSALVVLSVRQAGGRGVPERVTGGLNPGLSLRPSRPHSGSPPLAHEAQALPSAVLSARHHLGV